MKIYDVDFGAGIKAPDGKTARFFVAALLEGKGTEPVYHGVVIAGCQLADYGGVRAVERKP